MCEGGHQPCIYASLHLVSATSKHMTPCKNVSWAADVQTGDCHRADHLLEAVLEGILEDMKNPPTPEKREVGSAAIPVVWVQRCPGNDTGMRKRAQLKECSPEQGVFGLECASCRSHSNRQRKG